MAFFSFFSPFATEIRNKEADIELISKAIGDMSSVTEALATLKGDNATIIQQLSSALRISTSSCENVAISNAENHAAEICATLAAKKASLQQEITMLRRSEAVYFAKLSEKFK